METKQKITIQHVINSKKMTTNQIKMFNREVEFKPIQSDDSRKIKITVIFPEDENHLDNLTTDHKSHIFVGLHDGNIALQ